MASEATLYLAFDGVLHPNLVSMREGSLPRLRAGGHTLFENIEILGQVLEACPSTKIVLHNWWVPILGYRATLRLLPESIRQHVVGATWRQVRGPRVRLAKAGTRRDWLQADILRRCPEQPALLDCDVRQVVPQLGDRACIVDNWRGIADSSRIQLLFELLGEGRASQEMKHTDERRSPCKSALQGVEVTGNIFDVCLTTGHTYPA